MTFLKAEQVQVFKHDGGDWHPDAQAEPPNPAVVDQLPDGAFPAASQLYICWREGHVVGKKLASRMPALREIEVREAMEADAVGVLEAVGKAEHCGALRSSLCRL